MMADREINGDRRLAPGPRLRYLAANFRRNLAGGTGRPRGVSWHPPQTGDARRGDGAPSPSRWLTEAFFRHQLPTLLPPGDISVLDVGCGSGRTCSLLAGAGYGGRYTGVDIDDYFAAGAWADSGFAVRFIRGDAHVAAAAGPFDLILSVSALEHIADDTALIKRLGGMLKPAGMQVHFLPAPAGLFVYLWHGYRQYGIGAIADRFGAAGTQIYRLGGAASFLLHLLAITVPEILLRRSPRRRWPGPYRTMLARCLALDRWAPLLPVIHVVCHQNKGAAG